MRQRVKIPYTTKTYEIEFSSTCRHEIHYSILHNTFVYSNGDRRHHKANMRISSQPQFQQTRQQAGRLVCYVEQTSKWQLANNCFSMPLNMHSADFQDLYRQTFQVLIGILFGIAGPNWDRSRENMEKHIYWWSLCVHWCYAKSLLCHE